ncbi:MAG: UvrD-helicase domain-containing protein [Desulfovibrionaceae bacterium]|nr:UvrD-helicase domain-containing protein [Desulfovibrionaceae bacterium]
MNFLADLHLHSRFSLATSKDLTTANLDAWARIKGLAVIGTADFTHPKWREELHATLKEDPLTGLYTLAGTTSTLPFVPDKSACMQQTAPLFCPQTEISCIYKKNGRVRKIHALIYVPTLEDADRFSDRLGKVGNINSDGRPIIGLSAHDLLELLLDTVPEGIMVPAHIWTPWFSLFGSRSGFDSLEECFEDLSDHIFALETGLSSDPPMNRYISHLDKYALISNSDAHSGSKLGREANLFQGTPSFQNIFNAIKAAALRITDQDKLPCQFLGTLEFFPEEGKYHLDGHRACNISLNPLETKELHNICPVCGKPLTIGVLHRVMELADRNNPGTLDQEPKYQSIMPLQEITAELLGMGVNAQKVLHTYGNILANLGPELDVLVNIPIEDISKYWDRLGEGINRLRTNAVQLKAGFDGEFGQVHLFAPEELGSTKKSTRRQKPVSSLQAPSANLQTLELFQAKPSAETKKSRIPATYSTEQKQALSYTQGPCLVIAGPGSGKTHVLLGRLNYLLQAQVPSSKILALTFTRRAACEMRTRLRSLRVDDHALPAIDTLHAFCWQYIKKLEPEAVLLSETSAQELFARANPQLDTRQRKHAWQKLAALREQGELDAPEYTELKTLYANYQESCKRHFNGKCYDFTGLLEHILDLISDTTEPYQAVLVDEIQDCSLLQLNVIRKLLNKNGDGFFGIGDPNQAIYAFRGAVDSAPKVLQNFYPQLKIFTLNISYRSSQQILDCAQHVLTPTNNLYLTAIEERKAQLNFCYTPSDTSEAQWIAKNCLNLLKVSSISVHKQEQELDLELAPADVAILVRYKFQITPIITALEQVGLPVSAPSTQAFYQDQVIAELLNRIDPTGPTPQDFPSLKDLGLWLEQQPWAGLGASNSPAFKQMLRFYERCGSWENFFAELVWLKEEEELKSRADAIQIMTLHAAKGLEFAACFLPGLETGLLPACPQLIGLNQQDTQEDAEEQRLFYVGLTRASQLLFLSAAKSRYIYGKQYHLALSPFFTAIRSLFHESQIQARSKHIQRQGSLL